MLRIYKSPASSCSKFFFIKTKNYIENNIKINKAIPLRFFI